MYPKVLYKHRGKSCTFGVSILLLPEGECGDKTEVRREQRGTEEKGGLRKE